MTHFIRVWKFCFVTSDQNKSKTPDITLEFLVTHWICSFWKSFNLKSTAERKPCNTDAGSQNDNKTPINKTHTHTHRTCLFALWYMCVCVCVTSGCVTLTIWALLGVAGWQRRPRGGEGEGSHETLTPRGHDAACRWRSSLCDLMCVYTPRSF